MCKCIQMCASVECNLFLFGFKNFHFSKTCHLYPAKARWFQIIFFLFIDRACTVIAKQSIYPVATVVLRYISMILCVAWCWPLSVAQPACVIAWMAKCSIVRIENIVEHVLWMMRKTLRENNLMAVNIGWLRCPMERTKGKNGQYICLCFAISSS